MSAEILVVFRLSIKIIDENCERKFHMMKTKQPELGKKILELRRAIGLTQEELVERCNINVRTIQRIEAGEVTPRPHTIRVIFEALNYEIPEPPDIESPDPVDGKWINGAVFSGAIYLAFSMVEAYMEYQVFTEGQGAISSVFYAGIKLGVGLFFLGFMYGFYLLGRRYPNSWIRIGSLLLSGATLLCLGADVLLYFSTNLSKEAVLVSQAILAGVLYPVFGVGVVEFKKRFGNLALVTGILFIITGISFLSIIFALPGLVVLTVAEVLGLVLLYRIGEGRVIPIQV